MTWASVSTKPLEDMDMDTEIVCKLLKLFINCSFIFLFFLEMKYIPFQIDSKVNIDECVCFFLILSVIQLDEEREKRRWKIHYNVSFSTKMCREKKKEKKREIVFQFKVKNNFCQFTYQNDAIDPAKTNRPLINSVNMVNKH